MSDHRPANRPWLSVAIALLAVITALSALTLPIPTAEAQPSCDAWQRPPETGTYVANYELSVTRSTTLARQPSHDTCGDPQVSAGSTLRVVAQHGAWRYGQLDGGSWGWIHTDALNVGSPPCDIAQRPPETGTYVTNYQRRVTQTITLARLPSHNSCGDPQANRNSTLRVVAEHGNWRYGQLDGGSWGWIHTNHLDGGTTTQPTPIPTPTPRPTSAPAPTPTPDTPPPPVPITDRCPTESAPPQEGTEVTPWRARANRQVDLAGAPTPLFLAMCTLGTIQRNDRVSVLGQTPDWFYIRWQPSSQPDEPPRVPIRGWVPRAAVSRDDPPTRPPQVRLFEDPFVCDGVARRAGEISGFEGFEPVQIVWNTSLSNRNADERGVRQFSWVCSPSQARDVRFSAFGEASLAQISFTLRTVRPPVHSPGPGDPY